MVHPTRSVNDLTTLLMFLSPVALAAAIFVNHAVFERAKLGPLVKFDPNARYTVEKYIRPQGCPNQSFHEGDIIPHACAAFEIDLKSANLYGLMTYPGRIRGKSSQWTRVGNDVLDLHCRLGNDPCEVYLVIPNRFQESSENKTISSPSPLNYKHPQG